MEQEVKDYIKQLKKKKKELEVFSKKYESIVKFLGISNLPECLLDENDNFIDFEYKFDEEDIDNRNRKSLREDIETIEEIIDLVQINDKAEKFPNIFEVALRKVEALNAIISDCSIFNIHSEEDYEDIELYLEIESISSLLGCFLYSKCNKGKTDKEQKENCKSCKYKKPCRKNNKLGEDEEDGILMLFLLLKYKYGIKTNEEDPLIDIVNKCIKKLNLKVQSIEYDDITKGPNLIIRVVSI